MQAKALRKNARLKFIKSQSSIVVFVFYYVVCDFMLMTITIPQWLIVFK